MQTQQRQQLLTTLAKSSLSDIKRFWQQSPDEYDYETIREPHTGMVMAVARAESRGEPFNLGEVSVSRCALRLSSGEMGVGYVMGRNCEHALYVAILDALAQNSNQYEVILQQVIKPLQCEIENKRLKQKRETAQTKVDFLTMVRGEDDE